MSMETYNESKHSFDTAYLVVIFVNTDEVAVAVILPGASFISSTTSAQSHVIQM